MHTLCIKIYFSTIISFSKIRLHAVAYIIYISSFYTNLRVSTKLENYNSIFCNCTLLLIENFKCLWQSLCLHFSYGYASNFSIILFFYRHFSFSFPFLFLVSQYWDCHRIFKATLDQRTLLQEPWRTTKESVWRLWKLSLCTTAAWPTDAVQHPFLRLFRFRLP